MVCFSCYYSSLLLLLPSAATGRLYARELVSNAQFAWSEFSELNPHTGHTTALVESSFIFGVEQSIEDVGAYDWGSKAFMYADDATFASCKVVDVPVKSAILAPHPSAGPSHLILLNGVSAMVSAGKAGGIFVFGVVAKLANDSMELKLPVLRKLSGRGGNTTIDILDLPPQVAAAPQVIPTFEEAAGMLHMVTAVLGSNLTRVSSIDVRSAAPASSASTTFNCHDVLPWSFPTALPWKAAALDGILYVVYNARLIHNALASVNLTSHSCELVYDFGIGMVQSRSSPLRLMRRTARFSPWPTARPYSGLFFTRLTFSRRRLLWSTSRSKRMLQTWCLGTEEGVPASLPPPHSGPQLAAYAASGAR